MVSLFNATGSTDYCIYKMWKQPTNALYFVMHFMYNIFTSMSRPVIRPSSGWCVLFIKNMTLKMAGLLAETCW